MGVSSQSWWPGGCPSVEWPVINVAWQGGQGTAQDPQPADNSVRGGHDRSASSTHAAQRIMACTITLARVRPVPGHIHVRLRGPQSKASLHSLPGSEMRCAARTTGMSSSSMSSSGAWGRQTRSRPPARPLDHQTSRRSPPPRRCHVSVTACAMHATLSTSLQVTLSHG